MTLTARPEERASIATTSSGYPPLPSPPPKQGTRFGRTLIAGLAITIVAAAVGAFAATATTDDPTPTIIRQTVAATTPLAPTGASGIDAATVGTAVIPSIATIEVGDVTGGNFVPSASGSGVVIDDSGHVVTNNHVVASASAARVVLPNGTVYPADLIGTDTTTDLAVLRIEATGLEPIKFGSSDALSVGDPAIAVGSPLGLEGGPSLSVGVISAVGREVQTSAEIVLYGMLQTDAPITSGSSGGALVDGSGALVGITTAVGVSNIGVEGIGFATPVEVVERVVTEIIATGRASHGVLGINGSTAYRTTDDGGLEPFGVTVQSVSPDSAASIVDLAESDVITAVGDVPVRTMDELISAFRRVGAGDSVVLHLGSGSTLEVTLGSG
jgi:putative serine protease PepD